jgi:hypothetical protein
MDDDDLRSRSTLQLLRLYADILTELVRRKVTRSRNAPAGDLAEWIAVTLYNGTLAPQSEKSWDVRAPDGRLIQVKARLIAQGDNRSHVYSPFRSWDFDVCLFIVLDAHTYDVVRAVEVPVAAVQAATSWSKHVNGNRVSTKVQLLKLDGAVDRTDETSAVIDTLGTHLG